MSEYVLFLDIDDTLSNIPSVSKNFSKGKNKFQRLVNRYFDRGGEEYFTLTSLLSHYNVKEFYKLCEALGIDNIKSIVISSTWRKAFTLERIRKTLYLKGLSFELVKKINDITPKFKEEMSRHRPEGISSDDYGFFRGPEILEYIEINKLDKKRCIVLDDMDLSKALGEMYYDLCDYSLGFEFKGLKEIWK